MTERLKQLFAQLKAQGLTVDDRRCMASFKLKGSFEGASAPGAEGAVSMNEDENHFYADFRALSAIVITDYSIDLTNKDVLKKSYKLLKGQTIYKNHELDVDEWVGVVAKTWWDESEAVPPGVNCTLKINKKWNEKTIDGIKEGAIHSVSTTIYFEYKKSHEMPDFWFRMGEDINGQIVRLIVTKIISYGEISLVWHGADGYARRLTAEGKGGQGREPGIEKDINGGKTVKLTRTIATMFMLNLASYGFNAGAQEVELDDAGSVMLMGDLARAFQELRQKNESLSGILTETLGADVKPDDYRNTLAAMSAQAKLGKKYLDDVRAEALSLAKLAEGKTDDEKFGESALGKMIQNADIETAVQLGDDYRIKAEEKYPLSCPQCGVKLTRASAKMDSGAAHDESGGLNVDNYKI